MQDQFWRFHELGELQAPKYRVAAIVLTYLAFALMAWVILQNLFTVAKYAFLHQSTNLSALSCFGALTGTC